MKTLLITLLTVGMSLTTLAESTPTPSPASNEIQSTSHKLQDALADTLNKTVQVMGDAKDFVVAQMPDVIKQLLLWKFYEALMPMLFFFIVAAWMGFLVSRLVHRGDWTPVTTGEGYDRDTNPKNGYPLMIFGIVKAFIGIVAIIFFTFSMNVTWLQIAVAPKVYLIEYAKSFVTNK
jgi:hypothetical protein